MLRLCVGLKRHRRVTAIVGAVLATVSIFAVGLSVSSSTENSAQLSAARLSVKGLIEPLLKDGKAVDGEVNDIHSLSAETESEDGRDLKREPVATEGASLAGRTELNAEQNLQNHRSLKEAPIGYFSTADNPTTSRSVSAGINCSWANATYNPPYFLTAVLLYRIYETDKAKLATKELKQWLQYLRYIGVEHVYAYDAYVTPDEFQNTALTKFSSDGYITLIDWSKHNPYTITGTQVAAYKHCKDKYHTETEWQTAIDIDEYPFSSVDTEPGFLYRYMKKYGKDNPTVSEISMQNYLFLGKPLERELLFERLWRHTHGPANRLVKPIYKPTNIEPSVSGGEKFFPFVYSHCDSIL